MFVVYIFVNFSPSLDNVQPLGTLEDNIFLFRVIVAVTLFLVKLVVLYDIWVLNFIVTPVFTWLFHEVMFPTVSWTLIVPEFIVAFSLFSTTSDLPDGQLFHVFPSIV